MEYSHCLSTVLDELCIEDESRSSKSKGRMGRRRYHHVDVGDDDSQFKSKNLGAERRRREKLSQRLLALRSLVPIITNMNKATIIEYAITYITELKKNVKVLSNQLLELEEEFQPMEETSIVEPYVRVTNVEGNKLWMKIIFEKRSVRFTKLIEALSSNGFELTDTNVTTSKGAVMVSSCVEVMYGEIMLEASIMTKLLQGIVENIWKYSMPGPFFSNIKEKNEDNVIVMFLLCD